MTRRWLLFLVVLVLSGCTIGWIGNGTGIEGSGNLTSETREVSGFTEIVLQGSASVNVEVTGDESLVIEAEDNLIAHLTSDVRGGTLWLGTDTAISPTRGATYTITAATLEGITVDGSGTVAASDVGGKQLVAHVNGSGDIDLPGLDLERLEAVISGSGDIKARGRATNLRIRMPGSGSFSGPELEAVGGEVTIAGSGLAVVNASDTLTAVIAGSGSVEYLGSPTVNSTIDGSGNVEPR